MKKLVLAGLMALIALPLLATDGPLTNLMNLRGRTDENGYLRMSAGTPGATDGPLTALANLMGRTDENGYLRVSLLNTAAAVTSGSGTGMTVSQTGFVGGTIYKVVVAKEAFRANAVTQDLTLGTLPAKTFLQGIVIDKTAAFVCGAVCTTATLSATVGKTAGQNEYLLSFDLDAAAAQYGDAASELGASLAPATVQTMLGDLGSWASTQAVILRATSGTGNWGNGTTTNLSAGSVTVYLVTVRFP